MIVNGKVCFASQDPHGGEQFISLEEDLFRVLLKQARSLEELRCLWFGFGERTQTANAKRQAMAKAVGA